MKPQGEWLRRRCLDDILAADVLATFSHIQPAPMHRAERLEPSVMARLQPLRAIRLLTLRLHGLRAAAKSVGLEFRRIDVGDHQRGMGRGGTYGVVPLGRSGGKCTAIHDQPVPAHGHLHRQSAGMRIAVQASAAVARRNPPK